jgi:Holliday junction resolvasome RuvABC endonuclease subunit
MSKDQKKSNTKLSKAKRAAAESGTKLDKAALGIRGKVTKKHLAVKYVNDTYGLSLRMSENDAADAIGLATAYTQNAVPCTGY